MNDKGIQLLSYAIFIAAIALIILNEFIHPLGQYTLELLLVAIAASLLPRIKTIVIGSNKLELVEKELKEVRQIAEAGTAASELGVAKAGYAVGKQTLGGLTGRKEKDLTSVVGMNESRNESVLDATDPQKGKWGGSPVVKDRRLTAKIERVPGSNELHKITVEVTSMNPKNPLQGEVTFHLHPTFSRDAIVKPVKGGKAELVLVAWGAFTIGAEADGGKTGLELDLTAVPGASEDFYLR